MSPAGQADAQSSQGFHSQVLRAAAPHVPPIQGYSIVGLGNLGGSRHCGSRLQPDGNAACQRHVKRGWRQRKCTEHGGVARVSWGGGSCLQITDGDETKQTISGNQLIAMQERNFHEDASEQYFD